MPDTLDKIKKDLFIKWSEHANKVGHEEFFDRINQLLTNARPNTSIFKVIIFLLENFQYYSRSSINTHLKQLHTILLEKKVSPLEDILHTYIQSDKERINSSIEYFIDYKRMNNIDKCLCSDNLKSIKESTWLEITQIAIIDDCCGSGASLEKFIEGTGLDFSNKTLYYIVIHMMSHANQKLSNIENKFNNFKIMPITITDSEKIFNNRNISQFKPQFIEYSKNKSIIDKYILGYDDTEALFSFYNNTPNNTLGLFWMNTQHNKAIFPRDTGKRPVWGRSPTLDQIKEDKNRRRAQLYNKKLKQCS